MFKIKKSNRPNFSRFFTCCAIYDANQSDLGNFIFYGVSAAAWQHASGIRRRRWRL